MKLAFNTLSDKRKILIASSVITVILLCITMVGGLFAHAWFRDYEDVSNPAILSNFVYTIQYSKNGGTWNSTTPDGCIPLDSLDDLTNLRIRIEYKGHSAAYLRTSLYGNFYNKHTGTNLPLPESFWSMTVSDNKHASYWNRLNGEDYWYYTKRLMGAQYEPTKTIIMPELTIHPAIDQLGDVSNHQEYEGKLYVVLDIVQPDRCEAFWGISSSEFVK